MLTLYIVHYEDIVYCQICGHCILSNMWTLYIVKYVDIVYCQICGQLDSVQIVLTLCTIKHVDIVQSSNGCDLEQVTLSTLGRTLTDSHSPAALNI